MNNRAEVQRIPSLSGVKTAYRKIAQILPPSPLLPLQVREKRIWCKAESLQPIGAFKLRGAWHRLTDIAEHRRGAGVVAFSSGNHAQGVAWAAQRLGMPATIVMPSDAPNVKVDRTRTLGAEVIFYDRMTEDRIAIAQKLADERRAVMVPSYDDPWVIEGQGSAGLEILDQMDEAPDLVVTPCGGGGLASGLALAIPGAHIAIVEPYGWDDMARSLDGGAIVPVGPNPPYTSCDALQTLQVSPLTFNVLRNRGATGFVVTETEIAAAMRHAKKELGLTLEPGGAVALAAVLAGKAAITNNTVLILSGGNVESHLFAAMTSA
jgi:threonine dehydratase